MTGCCKRCHIARSNRRRADPQVWARQLAAKREKGRLNRAAITKQKIRWRIENPEKSRAVNRAVNAVAYAIKNHGLVRGRCESCGTDKNVCGFPNDYSKPLAVTWSCQRCRNKARRQAAAAASSSKAEMSVESTRR
jgi:hypothetical protein